MSLQPHLSDHESESHSIHRMELVTGLNAEMNGFILPNMLIGVCSNWPPYPFNKEHGRLITRFCCVCHADKDNTLQNNSLRPVISWLCSKQVWGLPSLCSSPVFSLPFFPFSFLLCIVHSFSPCSRIFYLLLRILSYFPLKIIFKRTCKNLLTVLSLRTNYYYSSISDSSPFFLS